MGRASALFFSSSEYALYNRITPSTEQRGFLQTQWNTLADHLKEQLAEISGMPISTWLQGSYKFGTLLKPVHLGEEYDVDVGIYFEWESERRATPAPRQLRDWVQAELLDYARATPEIKNIIDPAKERCSRAIYACQFHLDTPVYHLDRDRDRRRLACQSNSWEDSDPKAIYKWFKNVVPESEREQVRRYRKAWAAVSFERENASRPSSLLLTVLAAQAFAKIQFWEWTALPDDDALIRVVKSIYERLTENRRAENPVDNSEERRRRGRRRRRPRPSTNGCCAAHRR